MVSSHEMGHEHSSRGAQAGCTLVHYCIKYGSCEFPHHLEDERLFSVSSLCLTAQSQQTLHTFVIFHKCILICRLGIFMACLLTGGTNFLRH